MKFLTVSVLIVGVILALAEEDGKYRPEATTVVAAAAVPVTTIRPLINTWNRNWNDPRVADPRWIDPRFENRGWNTWNRPNVTNDWNRNAWNRGSWESRYNVDGK
jgi:hypothetical protein